MIENIVTVSYFHNRTTNKGSEAIREEQRKFIKLRVVSEYIVSGTTHYLCVIETIPDKIKGDLKDHNVGDTVHILPDYIIRIDGKPLYSDPD
jgi:hypothetical protein